MVDQDAAHQRGSHREKVRAIAPLHPIEICQAQVRLADDRGRLERVARPLVLHVVVREAPQLRVDDRHEGIAGGRIMLRPGG